MRNYFKFILLFTYLLIFLYTSAAATNQNTMDDGYDLWLRYEFIEDNNLRDNYLSYFKNIQLPGSSKTVEVIKNELLTGFESMFSEDFENLNVLFSNGPSKSKNEVTRGGNVTKGGIKFTLLNKRGIKVGSFISTEQEGYKLTSNAHDKTISIESYSEAGLLYGTFHLLSLMQKHESIDNLHIVESPKLQVRMLNHWDNLNGTIERGYAGKSIYKWDDLPDGDLSRYHDYARANASIGINAIAINSVNADPNIMRPEYLQKVKRIAEVFRPYNIKLFLSINFSAPMPPSDTPHTLKKWGGIGDLDKSDPLDEEVIKWWTRKVDEIYNIIPDFGGFLVKANSEGMPGPHDYGRDHAEGANMFARILKPHGGIMIWRAFVYSHQKGVDRVKQAYTEFVGLDGKFEDNVLLQIKNGPLDFQPSEPPSPLFGAMKDTNLVPELQLTQEYLGHSTYLVYLAEMWELFLDFETYQPGVEQSRIADLIQSDRQPITGMVGVANAGDDRNWTGHHFGQANWYLFGKLAWNPDVNIDKTTKDWIKLTWTKDKETLNTIKGIMDRSLDNFIYLQTPFGLPVTVDIPLHYYPALDRRNGSYWSANSEGIGFDRSSTGSDYVSQYHEPNRQMYDNIEACPQDLLLFFHFINWDYQINNNETFYDLFIRKNNESVRSMRSDANLWEQLKPNIDPMRHEEVSRKFEQQLQDAQKFNESYLEFINRAINN